MNLWCIIISLVTILAVALMLQKTRIGKAMRAVADNRDLAASSGINVDRVILLVWALAGGLAALGGVLFAVSELGGRVQWEMGFKLLLLMFAGITLGGLGNAYGAPCWAASSSASSSSSPPSGSVPTSSTSADC